MNNNRVYNALTAALLLTALATSSVVYAQTIAVSSEPATAALQPAVTETESPSPKLLTNFMESGGSYLTLTNGYGYWASGYTRGVYEKGSNIWNGEVNGQREFGDAGVYFAAGDTHTFSPDWYGALTIGSSAGGFFWPRIRTDAFLNRKLLARKQLVTTIGYGYFAAKDAHRSHSFYLGSTYYFDRPWIVEEGLYLNVSNPGAVFAPSGFVAVTRGSNKHQYITVRAGLGEEGYQLIGPTVTLTQFQSQALTITWRKWLGTNWGFNLVGDYYRNPFYSRGGSTIGLFKEF